MRDLDEEIERVPVAVLMTMTSDLAFAMDMAKEHHETPTVFFRRCWSTELTLFRARAMVASAASHIDYERREAEMKRNARKAKRTGRR